MFRSLAVALSLTLAAPAFAAASKSEPASSSAVHESTLPNGLRVLVIEDHAAPVATFAVFYKVGSRNEYVGITGSAHLLEHMQFKGTERFKKGQIMAALDRIGASWNANTFYDYTNYFETVPVDQLDFVMGLEADRMQHSLILDQERDLERIVVRNELERGENNPIRALSQEIGATAFKAHPYHHPVIGWRSDVEGVPTQKLRDFYGTYYQPDNAIAVVVGDLPVKDAEAMVQKHFGPLKGGHSFPPVYTTEPAQNGERRVVIRKPGDLKVVALGWKVPPASDPDTVPLKLIHLMLTGELDLGPYGDPLDSGIANRFYQALVDKELATRASVDYTPLKDSSLFLAIATPRPDVEHQKVEDAVRAQVEKLKTEKVSDKELARAKARAQAAVAMMQDGTYGRAMLVGYFATIADWHLADDFTKKIQAVTPDEIQRVAQKYFQDDQLTVGWFIPTKKDEKAPKAMKTDASPVDFHAERLPAFKHEDTAALSKAVAMNATAQAKTERIVLPNGLVLLVRENHASPTFSISGRIKAGAAFDEAGKPHVAGITSRMLMRGTQKHSRLQIAESLEEVGASLGYGPGSEEVSLSARGLSRDFDRVMDLLAETLTQPSFPAEEVEKLKRETVAGLKQAEDSTGTRGWRAMNQALYPKGHPYYSYDLDDSVAAVNAITPETLKAFHAAHYGADGTVIAVVGDVNAKKVAEAVKARLSSMKKLGQKLAIADVPMRKEGGKQVVFVPEKANVDVLLGAQGGIKRTDPDYYPAMVANFGLGGAASSRLFQEVRDRQGLTYGIYSSLTASHGAGAWVVSMTLNPQNVDKALPVVQRMAKEFAEKGLTDEEIAAAKDTLMGSYKVGLATNSGVAGVLAAFESYGFPVDFIEEHPKKIAAVTADDVRRVLAAHFKPDADYLVIAGTYPAAETAERKSEKEAVPAKGAKK